MSMFLDGNPVMRWIANIRDYGLEYAIRRFYAIYGGEVVDVEDSRSQARARVKVGALGVGTVRSNKSFDPITHPKRALPSSIYAGPDHGVYFPPEPGDAVWVAFNHGDSEHPHYVGSWWRNKSASGNAADSEVPAEFKMPMPEAAPKLRGIKTSRGHGMIFSDEASAPYVALWSGEQQTAGKSAFRKNQITLSDTEGVPNVKEMVDPSVKTGIYANTHYGHVLQLNDTDKKIVLSGLRGDPGPNIANALVIEDLTGTVTIKTKTQQKIVVDDATGTITVDNASAAGAGIINVLSKAATNVTTAGVVTVTAGGAATITAAGGVAVGSGAAPPAPPIPGVAVETGIGAKIINFAGAVTETVGSFVQNAASTIFTSGLFTVNSALITLGPVPGVGIIIVGNDVVIGDLLTAQRACNEQLITWLKTHTHAGPGAPPDQAIQLQDPLNPLEPNPLYVTQTEIS
ncbi:MAG: phage baseplate assembly protein V [Nitrospira sp.]